MFSGILVPPPGVGIAIVVNAFGVAPPVFRAASRLEGVVPKGMLPIPDFFPPE